MTVWAQRPPETAALFNPALLAATCARIASGWSKETGGPLPLPIAFPACALLLHEGARTALPDTRRTRLAPWIENHSRERLEVADLAVALAPRIREGLRLGLRHGVITAQPPGVRGFPPAPSWTAVSEETRTILSRANWVGQWLADAGSSTTVLALIGPPR
jgi:hypothetical protein